jgi:hypothetical protein
MRSELMRSSSTWALGGDKPFDPESEVVWEYGGGGAAVNLRYQLWCKEGSRGRDKKPTWHEGWEQVSKNLRICLVDGYGLR